MIFHMTDEVTRLGQFLKLMDAVESGGEAKMRIADGDVRVNGEVELRRGRQLQADDVVTIDGKSYKVI
jgi:ribosome-associated protein